MEVKLSNGVTIKATWEHVRRKQKALFPVKGVEDDDGNPIPLFIKLDTVNPKGGSTVCEVSLINAENEIVYMAKSTQNCSYRDNFIKRKGRELSFKKAITKLFVKCEFSEEVRKEFWDFYKYKEKKIIARQ